MKYTVISCNNLYKFLGIQLWVYRSLNTAYIQNESKLLFSCTVSVRIKNNHNTELKFPIVNLRFSCISIIKYTDF